MKVKRFTVFVIVLSIFILSGSITWAGKPQPQTYHTEYGSATLTNLETYQIWNDGADQYIDMHKEGSSNDLVELEIYDSNKSLKSIHVYLGKPELPYRSFRKVELPFYFMDITPNDTYYSNYINNKAVYDILKSKGFLNNDTIHADIVAYPGSKLRVQFIVDPECIGESGAITQSAVNGYYTDDANPAYWTAKIAEPSSEADAHDHIIYTLYYDLPFGVAVNNTTFTITTTGSAILAVGRLKGTKSATHDIVYLAECSVPFQLTVTSLGVLNAAPRKQDTISTSWGETKTALYR